MATGGLYGNSGTGALIAQPGTETPGLYGKSPNGSVVAQPGSESAGLYGNGTTFGGYYFEWFVFQTSATQPATPTGGSWNFQTDSGTAPSGWTNAPASNPTNPVWISIALVNSRSTSPLVWSTPGVLSYSGTINGSGAPTSGIGQIGELYIQTGVNPNALWFKSGSTTWTQITGSALYVDLTSSQTIAGTKTFSSTIQGNISGNAGTVTNGVYTDGSYVNPSWIASLAGSKITGNISGNAANVTGTVAIVNGGTGATTASGARTNLGLGTIATQDASSVAITGGSITGITDLAIADGGTGASTAGQARTNLGLGTAAVLDAGVANGVATLDAGGTVPLSQIPASIQGGVSYQGAWNASTNTPTLASSVGTKGYYYVVSVAGSTNLNGVTSWNIGDWAIFNGTAWEKIDNTDAVTSVNGFTGTVVLTAANVNALAIANNLSDLANAGTARTNLGLGTAATQNSTAFATAAQGATADTALQTVTSADGSIVVLQTGTNIDLAVSAASPASTLLTQVRNTTGATLTKGTVVYISGATGQISTVSKANASSDATSAQTLGMITANLANNSNGYVTVFGLLQNMDTSAYTDGAQLYLSGTVAGAVTATKPSAPIHLVYVAIVEYAHPTQGKLLVKVQNGYELAEIHDVSIVSPTTGQTLVYDSVTDLWSNSNAPTITGGTINNTTVGATTPAAGTFTTLTARGTGQNLVLYSEQFDNAAWTKSNSAVTANSTTAPDGTTTADTLTLTGGGTLSRTYQSVSFVTGVQYTQSCYVKTGTQSFVQMTYGASAFGSSQYANFDISSGALGTVTGGTAAITSVGSGWYRISFSAVAAFTVSDFAVQIIGVDSTTSARISTLTASNKTVFIWGGQSELGSTANTYIPTTTTAVYGTPTLSFSGVASIGLQSDGSLYETSAGTGNVRFYTNNIAQEQARVSHTTSAVNYMQLTGAVTGGNVQLSAQGSDSSVGISLVSKGGGGSVWKGDGGVYFQNNAANNLFSVENTSSTVNRLTATGSVTGSGPRLFAQGSDTNIDLNLTTKGTGAVNLNTGNGNALRVADLGGTVVAGLGVFAGSSSQNSVYLVPYGSVTNGNFIIAAKGSQFVGIGTNTNNNSNATEQMRVTHTASAVNYVQVTGAATGGTPTISAQGSDSNIGLGFSAKLFANTNFFAAGGFAQFQIGATASAVNYFQTKGSITGFGPVLSAQGSDTNIPAVVQPKGTGALQAQQTTSTDVGGNARGANAVDFQTARDTAAKVASGQYAVVSGGYGNVASAFTTFVGGGYTNTASGYSATIAGGTLCVGSGPYVSTTGGYGNGNTGYASVIGGGYDNSVSGNFTVVVGGRNNVATGQQSVTVGGYLNTAAGYQNFIGGGFTNSGTSGSAVTTQSGTMNGTTAVTLSGSNASIKVGQLVEGTSLGNDTYVAAISGTSLTLSKVAIGSSTSTLSFFTPHGVVVGGGNNQATGSYSFIGGGGDAGTAANRNVASGDWSVVVGGRNNTASGPASFIGGGGTWPILSPATLPNVATAVAAFIGAGLSNTASNDGAAVVGGQGNTASGARSFVGGGLANTSNANNSAILGGSYGTTRLVIGNHVFPACDTPVATSVGVSQSGLLVLGTQTTDATATILRSTTSAAGTTNQVILPNNSAYYFKGSVIANVTGAANGAAWSIEGAIMRGANAASTVLIDTPSVNRVAASSGASAWVVAVTADTTNGGLAVTVTGAASTTIRWVCRAETCEVTF